MNWAEVLYKMERKQGKTGLETARQFERTTPLEAVPVDRELAEAAALLKNEHRLGLADAFAAALAKTKKPNWSPPTKNSKPWKGNQN